MFGVVIASMEDLSQEEKDRYHEAYCGLCWTLRDTCGQASRMTLSYDMAFLGLLLGSLYEPEEKRASARCPIHPTKVYDYIRSECMDYAADATVVLAYHKCLDDWNDEGKVSARVGAGALASAYAKAKARNPHMVEAVERGMARIGELEAAREASLDAAGNAFGVLLGEVFAWRNDFWEPSLRALGARVGKLIYMMDAALDFQEDSRSGSYNPLVIMRDGLVSSGEEASVETADEVVREMAYEMLLKLAADVAAEFEKLPLERDEHLLSSVVYAGVWQKYNAQQHENRAGDGNEGKDVG